MLPNRWPTRSLRHRTQESRLSAQKHAFANAAQQTLSNELCSAGLPSHYSTSHDMEGAVTYIAATVCAAPTRTWTKHSNSSCLVQRAKRLLRRARLCWAAKASQRIPEAERRCQNDGSHDRCCIEHKNLDCLLQTRPLRMPHNRHSPTNSALLACQVITAHPMLWKALSHI